MKCISKARERRTHLECVWQTVRQEVSTGAFIWVISMVRQPVFLNSYQVQIQELEGHQMGFTNGGPQTHKLHHNTSVELAAA